MGWNMVCGGCWKCDFGKCIFLFSVFVTLLPVRVCAVTDGLFWSSSDGECSWKTTLYHVSSLPFYFNFVPLQGHNIYISTVHNSDAVSKWRGPHLCSVPGTLHCSEQQSLLMTIGQSRGLIASDTNNFAICSCVRVCVCARVPSHKHPWRSSTVIFH